MGEAISSASGGLQEALIAARFTPTNPNGASQSGKVIVPPGQYKAFARVSIRASNISVDFSGSIVECWMNDTCIFVGEPGRVKLIEDRVTQLEKSEIRRSVYDRIVNAAITVAISAAIAMHDRWSFK